MGADPGRSELRGKPQIGAIGVGLSEMPASDRKSMEHPVELVPFGDQHIDIELAAAAISFFRMKASSDAYSGWRRGAWGLLTWASLGIDLTYPAWPRLPGREREAFVASLVRTFRVRDLVVNRRLLVHQTRLRRLLGRLPVTDLD